MLPSVDGQKIHCSSFSAAACVREVYELGGWANGREGPNYRIIHQCSGTYQCTRHVTDLQWYRTILQNLSGLLFSVSNQQGFKE